MGGLRKDSSNTRISLDERRKGLTGLSEVCLFKMVRFYLNKNELSEVKFPVFGPNPRRRSNRGSREQSWLALLFGLYHMTAPLVPKIFASVSGMRGTSDSDVERGLRGQRLIGGRGALTGRVSD